MKLSNDFPGGWVLFHTNIHFFPPVFGKLNMLKTQNIHFYTVF